MSADLRRWQVRARRAEAALRVLADAAARCVRASAAGGYATVLDRTWVRDLPALEEALKQARSAMEPRRRTDMNTPRGSRVRRP